MICRRHGHTTSQSQPHISSVTRWALICTDGVIVPVMHTVNTEGRWECVVEGIKGGRTYPQRARAQMAIILLRIGTLNRALGGC